MPQLVRAGSHSTAATSPGRPASRILRSTGSASASGGAAPPPTAPDVESFLYWSKERLANKAVVSVTHVSMVRGRQLPQPGVPDTASNLDAKG